VKEETMTTRALIVSSIAALFLVACAAEDSNELGKNGNDPNDPNNPNNPNDPNNPNNPNNPDPNNPDPTGCKLGAPHVGFGSTNFIEGRKEAEIGVDRRRIKPYSALSSEFQRTLGAVPTNLATSQAAFGQTPNRWYSEPQAGAVSLYSTYTMSFQACYDTLTAATYTTAPTAATAATECAAMQRKFWQRTPTADEIKACSDFTSGTTDEPVARRRWAHACASIMTSTGFTTY